MYISFLWSSSGWHSWACLVRISQLGEIAIFGISRICILFSYFRNILFLNFFNADAFIRNQLYFVGFSWRRFSEEAHGRLPQQSLQSGPRITIFTSRGKLKWKIILITLTDEFNVIPKTQRKSLLSFPGHISLIVCLCWTHTEWCRA